MGAKFKPTRLIVSKYQKTGVPFPIIILVMCGRGGNMPFIPSLSYLDIATSINVNFPTNRCTSTSITPPEAIAALMRQIQWLVSFITHYLFCFVGSKTSVKFSLMYSSFLH